MRRQCASSGNFRFEKFVLALRKYVYSVRENVDSSDEYFALCDQLLCQSLLSKDVLILISLCFEVCVLFCSLLELLLTSNMFVHCRRRE